ncbi:hypothetical protein SAMN05518856_103339 [Paenibacillus sp. OK003]|nr:hypothetical protein SAMN05518856_103339 [Paenibacillus sp. OK003]
MSKRSQVSLEAKLRAVKHCIAFKSSPNQEARQFIPSHMNWTIRKRPRSMTCLIRKYMHGFGNTKRVKKRLSEIIGDIKSL